MLRPFTLGTIAAVIMLLATTESALCDAPRLDADIIKAGLRTMEIEEDGFVEEVVEMAEDGYLPWSMVDNVFSWAKRKPRHKFQYFRKALIELAASKGIAIPRPPKQVEPAKKSPFFIQKLKDFYAKLKGITATLPLIGGK